ncbi:MAG TPA: hypothetical protein VNA24_08340 [Hyalangium sp.]|nr:hypothetical protein [Hyalangium sp.]
MQAQPTTDTPELRELHEHCTRIRQLLAAGHANCHEIGVRYNHAVENKLAEKAGYKNAPEFFCQQLKELSRATLVAYGTVAKEFTAEMCGRYGVTTLKLLITYAEASGSELDTNDPGTMLVEVPNEHGEVDTRFFGECTVTDLRKALQRLRRPTSSKPLPADTRSRAEQCRTLWSAYFPEKLGVRVEVSNRKGKAVMSLKDIPLEQLEQLTALLAPTLQPARVPSQLQARG